MVQPTGVYGLGVDPGTPSEAYHFAQCVRPYFAARALEGIAQPGPDAPAVQRQAYADLDECLQRATLAKRNGPNILVVRPPVIRITALNTDGTSLWAGDDWAEPRLTVCMREKGYSVDGDRAYPPGTTR